MSEVIQILIIAVLIVSFFAVGRLYFVLGSVRQTLVNLEVTRAEISSTVGRLDTAVHTAQTLLDEEVAPTLRVAREALVNVEIITRALAETTLAVRRLTGKAEGVVNAKQLVKLGGPLLQQLAKRSAHVVSGIFGGIGSAVRGVLGRRKQAKSQESANEQVADGTQKALPAPARSKAKRSSEAARSISVAPVTKKR